MGYKGICAADMIKMKAEKCGRSGTSEQSFMWNRQSFTLVATASLL